MTYPQIIKAVCNEFGIYPTQLLCKNRKRLFVEARKNLSYFLYICFVINKQKTEQQIENEIGLDRSSLNYGYRKSLELIVTEPQYRLRIENIKTALNYKKPLCAKSKYMLLMQLPKEKLVEMLMGVG